MGGRKSRGKGATGVEVEGRGEHLQEIDKKSRSERMKAESIISNIKKETFGKKFRLN